MKSSLVQRSKQDDGFTLVELLVVVAVGSIVIVAITGVMITTFKTQDETADRLAASHDTQLVATWLPFDTASAAITGWDNAPGTANPCTTSTGTSVMKLPYASDGVNNTAQVVNYRLEQDGTVRNLVRYQCAGTGAGAFSRIVLARSLRDTSDAATTAINCAGAPTCTSRISITLLIHLSNGQDVTYDGDSRTGTTLGAFATTTTASTTTTSTTSTTTTSTTLPQCTVTSMTLNPASVGRSTSGSNTDKLAQNVSVSVGVANCTGTTLSIQYTRKYQGTDFPTTTTLTGSGTPRTATIQGAPQGEKFDTGTYVISVSGASNAFSSNLTVT